MTTKRRNSATQLPISVHVNQTEEEQEEAAAAAETRKYAFVNQNDVTTALTPQAHKKPTPSRNENSMSSGEVRGTRVRGGRPEAKITSQKVTAFTSLSPAPS
jgi:hypothetical protein